MIQRSSNASFDRVHYVEKVNDTVLKMIHNKKYPSAPDKINHILKKTERYQLTKVKALPKDTQNTVKMPQSSNFLLQELPYRSIGDHLQY